MTDTFELEFGQIYVCSSLSGEKVNTENILAEIDIKVLKKQMIWWPTNGWGQKQSMPTQQEVISGINGYTEKSRLNSYPKETETVTEPSLDASTATLNHKTIVLANPKFYEVATIITTP